MTHSSPTGTCPNCGRPLPAHPPAPHCPRCALPLAGRLFEGLRWADGELRRLEQQRGALFAYRRRLIDEWRAGAVPGSAAAPPHPPPQGWHTPAPVRRRPDASPRTARNVLLVLGGVLLTVAALAFTLLSWGSMGIGGRAAVLGTVTLAATGLPVALLRRSLHATAEAVAGVGLVLLLLDAYALRQVTAQDTDALRYTAVALAVVAVLWTAYGLLLRDDGAPGTRGPGGDGGSRPGLRLPLPAAVVLGQLPVPLWAAATGAGTYGMAWSLLATAAADVLLVAVLAGRRPLPAVRVTGAVTALLAGGTALLLAGELSVGAQETQAAARVGALLLAGAGVLLYAAHRERAFALPLGCAAGVLLIAAAGGLVRTLVPSGVWVVPGYLLCAVVLAGAVVERPSAPVRGTRRSSTAGLLLAAGAMHGIAVLYGSPAVLQALLEPLMRVASPWQGAPAGAARTALAAGTPWTGDAGTPVLLAVPALVLGVVSRMPGLEAVRRPATAAALALGCAAAVVTPLALGLSYAAVTCWLVVLVMGLLALSVALLPAPHGSAASVTGTSAALLTGVTATGWALAARPATLAVLSALTAGFAAAVWASARPHGAATSGDTEGARRHGDAPTAAADDDDAAEQRSTPPAGPVDGAPGKTPSAAAVPGLAGRVRQAAPSCAARVAHSALCAAAAVLSAAGLARALPAALGVPGEQAAFAVLALAAATALLAARLRPAALRAVGAGPAGEGTRGEGTRGEGTAGGDAPGEKTPAGVPGAVSLAVECAGYGAAGWALVLSATSAPLLALALGLCGVLAGGVALRGDRRPAGHVATAFFLLATWVRLYASEVSVPEAYGLPLAAAALAVGVPRARRTPGLSSWTVYGPALSCALLPSLVMVWGDPHWLRPLLLGAGSLTVTLLGARLRLQAPLLAGGSVLALVAAHELAPYVTQVIGLLPRWLPPALAGLLLLAVGATYEHRLRDARRLSAAFRRLG